ncbi:MAG: M3 family oligoendopeptidase [Clostridia bacterium]|nr:M3 family oligoendopeptidase [Clostridia bacterium]
MKFSEMPYERPDVEALLADLADAAARFEQATSASAQLDVLRDVEKISSKFGTMATIASIRNSVDTRDEFYAGEKAFYDQVGPLIAEKAQLLSLAMLRSPFRAELERELGKVTFINTEMEIKSFSPEIIPLMQEENALTSAYQKLYASAKIPFDGKELTVAQLGIYTQSPDRAVRKAAVEAQASFFDANQAEFDEIFDKLVKNRTEQAKKLGFDNFVPLGYLRRQRNCYGLPEVATFRRQIIEDVVPVVDKIKARQKERIGVADFKFYDNGFVFPDGNPTPKGTPEEILAAGRQMYTELSPETADFIAQMFEMDLFDVLAKEGKAPGGYCTELSEYRVPFIFSNFNGTAGDVDVLTHEAGHAFAAYMAYRHIPWSMSRQPSMEGCETHSMSMEFLTSPWHHLFFKEDTAKYAQSHAEDALIFLPYGTMVDHFQEIVYSHPELTPAERNAEWAKLEKIYRPYLDMEGVPFYGRGAGWQRQLHIYLYPFYYLDYCMAQAMSLEFFSLHLQDAKYAWEKYLDFVKLGGTKTFVGLIEAVGLKSPLKEGTLKAITAELDEWLDKNSI